MNAVYREYFPPGEEPARVTIQSPLQRILALGAAIRVNLRLSAASCLRSSNDALEPTIPPL